jgi:mRNA degradation ribonuclease J1/J2
MRTEIWAFKSAIMLWGMHQRGHHMAIDQIDLDYIVPIHTEARDWFAKNFEKVVLVEK